MKWIGLLGFFLVIAFIALELWVFIMVTAAMNEDFLLSAILVIAMSIAGWQLFKFKRKTLSSALMEGKIATAFIGLFGSILLIVPGFVTGVLGVFMLLPPVQKLFSGASAKLLQYAMRKSASKMGAGAFGGAAFAKGAPTGFGGMGGFGGPNGPFGQQAARGGNPFSAGMQEEQMKKMDDLIAGKGNPFAGMSPAQKKQLQNMMKNMKPDDKR